MTRRPKTYRLGERSMDLIAAALSPGTRPKVHPMAEAHGLLGTEVHPSALETGRVVVTLPAPPEGWRYVLEQIAEAKARDGTP